MRTAHSIEVQLFEKEDVFQHPFLCQSFASSLIMLMATNALDQDGLVVVEQLFPFYFVPLEAYLHAT